MKTGFVSMLIISFNISCNPIMKMDISLTEALTGLKKTIKSLDDRTLVIQTVSGRFSYSSTFIYMVLFQARLSRLVM